MRILRHAEVGSTTAIARTLANEGDLGPLWIQADSQTAGRGRRGRQWSSPKGNLYCTTLMPHDGPIASAAQLGFIAAIAVSQLCEVYAPDVRAALKWPNDVRIDGAKISGILLESGQSSGRNWVSVGIGVNLLSAPKEAPYPVTSIAAHMDTLDPEAIPDPLSALATLAGYFEGLRNVWLAKGFAPIRDDWLARTDGIGKTVTANLSGRTVIGTMTGLSESGDLMLCLPDGTDARISSGEVFFS